MTGIGKMALVGILPILVVWVGVALFPVNKGRPAKPVIESVRVSPAVLPRYGEPGVFSMDGRIVDAPLHARRVGNTLEVMKYQVSQGEYARCVADGACVSVTAGSEPATHAMPVTGVNYWEAQTYAQWLSRSTGQRWRLPSDLEWIHFADVAFQETVQADASKSWTDQWMARYRRESARARESSRRVYPQGHFGVNESGIADTGGNVWEWTETCFERITLDRAGNIESRADFCGVRVLQGEHRSYMPEFVRDASSGGCGVGLPPDYIGLRLVRDIRWYERFLSIFL